MKVAHVVPTFYPNVGGMGTVAYEEAKRLASAGFDITVFTPKYDDEKEKEEKDGFKIERIRPVVKSGNAGAIPSLFFKLKDFDLVHLHYPFYGGTHIVYFASLLLRKKVILTYHMDATPSSLFQKIIQAVYDFLFAKAIFKKSKKIISIGNDFISNKKLKKIMKDKTAEIYNGVDTKSFKKREIMDRDLLKYKNKKVFLFVGNLLEIKRLDLLIKAVEIIKNDKILLLVVGDGYNVDEYKKMVKEKKLEEVIIFIGESTKIDKLIDLYNLAICTVVPSEFESFSLVALESMSCSTPVIMSDVAGARKRIVDEKDGYLFKSNDVDDLAKKMQIMIDLDDDKIDEMGQEGRMRVQEKYDWDNHIKKLIEVYNNC